MPFRRTTVHNDTNSSLFQGFLVGCDRNKRKVFERTIGIDHEYIAENAPQGDEPPTERPDVTSVYCEVMQMGACLLDDDGNEIVVLNQTVKAHRIHAIPPWLSNMTGMTEERREREGVSFPDALLELSVFVGACRVPWTFNGDWWVLEGNARAHGITLPFNRPFKRVKPRLAGWGVTLKDYQRLGFTEMNSGDLHKVLGIELPSIEGVGAHDAAHDARSLAHSVHRLVNSV